MHNFIALVHPMRYQPSKRDALMFDEIGAIGLYRNQPYLSTELAAEYDWLQEHGVVRDIWVEAPDASEQTEDHLHHLSCIFGLGLAASFLRRKEGSLSRKHFPTLAEFEDNIARFPFASQIDVSEAARVASITIDEVIDRILPSARPSQLSDELQRIDDIADWHSLRQLLPVVAQRDACDVTVLTPVVPNDASDAKSVVLNVVLHELPEPEVSTPWEAILDFRSNPDARRALRRLRRWIRQLSVTPLTPYAAHEELEYLVDEYTQHMKLHKIKFEKSNMEVLLTIAAEAVESLMRFRIADAVRALFSMREHRLRLSEAELSAPGRDIAYVIKAREKFGAG